MDASLVPFSEIDGPEFLRRRRRALGLTQRELSRRTNVPQSHISAFENRRRPLSPNERDRLESDVMVKPSVLLDLHREELRRVFKDSGFTDVAVFGSVARGMDTSESDIDFLISHDRAVGLFAIGNLSRKIENILAAPVDIVVNTGRQGPRLAKAQAEAVAL